MSLQVGASSSKEQKNQRLAFQDIFSGSCRDILGCDAQLNAQVKDLADLHKCPSRGLVTELGRTSSGA